MIRAIVLAAILALVVTADNATAQDNAGPLVSTNWLSQNIDNDDICVIDLAHRIKDYRRGHIAGAIFVDWKVDIINPEQPDSYTLPKQEAWEKLLSRIGVTPETHVILTDNLDNRLSVRMYWTLKHFGHARISVLDGGTLAWSEGGFDMDTEVPIREETDYRVTKTNDDIVVAIDEVRAAIEDDEVHLIDGRPTGQYTGESPGKVFNTGKEHRRRGHVTEALSIPWNANLNDDGTFKSPDELRQVYEGSGMANADSVITYCNEGLHAAMPWFVLYELLGEKGITLYDDSMAEWANRDDTPMETEDFDR